MLFSKHAECNRRGCRFMEEQEANGLMSQLGIRTSFSKILLLCYIFFLSGLSFTNNHNSQATSIHLADT